MISEVSQIGDRIKHHTALPNQPHGSRWHIGFGASPPRGREWENPRDGRAEPRAFCHENQGHSQVPFSQPGSPEPSKGGALKSQSWEQRGQRSCRAGAAISDAFHFCSDTQLLLRLPCVQKDVAPVSLRIQLHS